MSKKKRAPGSEPPRPASSDAGVRDLVTMYARLTQTLENACGLDALADYLAGSRAAPAPEKDGAAAPALARMFKRLGILDSANEPQAFLPSFVAQMAAAVSRPEAHILLLLGLFAAGNEALRLKPVCGATPLCLSCRLTRECEYFNNPRTPEAALLTPAARLLSGNEKALSDSELLAVAMYGEKATGLEEVVATLFSRYGRLRALFSADAHEFQAIRDMGRPQALRLAAMGALHRRLLAERREEMLHIASAADIYGRYAAELREYRVEAAVLLMLDQQHNVIRDAWFCDGSPNMAHIGIADLLRPAVREYASRIALIHNHPSDNPTPSGADMDFTRRLRSACDIIGLVLIDHVIVTESGYFSFAEQGMLGL